MSFDRWMSRPSILPASSSSESDNPRISLSFEKDIPDLSAKIFDRLFNYHVVAEQQVNELLQQFEYSKITEKAEKHLNESEKNVEQTSTKIVQCTNILVENLPEFQKSLSISLALGNEWMKKRIKPHQPIQSVSPSTSNSVSSSSSTTSGVLPSSSHPSSANTEQQEKQL
ncbi:hypothetical protein FDP41_012838 [Naegleria fowleri]|uniref:Uncharacterized protein n=1 Tax=Naegleria fowleri TaxID=5763 RepID=A0A6A5C5C6_NAEFO|nr:uncharacterized protein FDP41_012838 [Naegleria fowleri]KAF0981050.1 hypothetical protein FDP41_012838 [Naegleria fowleri]CAG4709035.1 unnamed protein product [Naegleria fowleri]